MGASTQNQAASALLFLYREVLGREVEGSVRVVRARSRHHLPLVLTRSEVRALLANKSVRTTMIYTHVLNRGGLGVRSPLLDGLVDDEGTRRGQPPNRPDRAD